MTLLNAVDGCMPSDLATGTEAELEEERRLLYVAMTRARDQLDIIVPRRFYVGHPCGVGDRHVYASRSRFIPAAIIEHFEQASWPEPAANGETALGEAIPAVDLTERMRAMWR